MNASQFILQRESPIFQEYDIDVTPHGEGNRRRRGGFFLGGETSPVKSQTHGGLGKKWTLFIYILKGLLSIYYNCHQTYEQFL